MIFALTLGLVLAVDQSSKALVRIFLPVGKSVNVIGRYIALRQTRNPGVVFGLFSNGNVFLLLIFSSLLIVLLTIYFMRDKKRLRIVDVSLGLICGGAIGNIIDRLLFGKVIDFIDLNFWPVFNLADAAIVVGVALLLYYFLRYYFKGDRREKGGENAP